MTKNAYFVMANLIKNTRILLLYGACPPYFHVLRAVAHPSDHYKNMHILSETAPHQIRLKVLIRLENSWMIRIRELFSLQSDSPMKSVLQVIIRLSASVINIL